MDINDSLAELMKIEGAQVVALVDSTSGMILGSRGDKHDIEIAAAGNTEVVRAKQRVMQSLKIKDAIEDILISLDHEYHIIRPIHNKPELFFYLVLDRSRANLALARRKTLDIEAEFTL